MKIVVIGNSVALRVRPPQASPANKNYTALLKEVSSEWTVVNKAKGATLTRHVLNQLDQHINEFPDYYLVNLGIVDACSREIPFWFYRVASKKGGNWFNRLNEILYRQFISKIRNTLTRIRFKTGWTSTTGFRRNMNQILFSLKKETNAHIIVMGINRCNDRIESQLPGSLSRIQKFNEIIEETCNILGCSFIDVSDLQHDQHYPDGIHYNIEGHQLVADRIIQSIQS